MKRFVQIYFQISYIIYLIHLWRAIARTFSFSIRLALERILSLFWTFNFKLSRVHTLETFLYPVSYKSSPRIDLCGLRIHAGLRTRDFVVLCIIK